METLFYILSTLTFLFLLSKLISWRKNKNFPPSPISLPIIGHLYLIKPPVHRTLQNITDKYGPIVSLRFGPRKVLIISSPALVEECFNKNDIIFADRPFRMVWQYVHYNQTTIGTSSYGPHWRNLRRISALEIFSINRLNLSSSIRLEEVQNLVRGLFEICGSNFTKVEMKSRLSELSFDIIMRMIAGKRYFGAQVEDLEEAKRFREILKETLAIGTLSNLGDFFPFLRWINYQGAKTKLQRLKEKNDKFCENLFDEHRNNKNGEVKIETMVQKMLSLQDSEPETYSDEMIKGLIMNLIHAGTDTSAVTLEWALSQLLNHPEALKKAKAELDEIVGQDRLVSESDCSKLPYLQNIIRETLRLHPAAPLLLPHQSSEDCTVGGHDIPKGTTLMVNAWAIHRDPTVWQGPTSFRPERFELTDSDTCKLIPFGVGRRSCPGAGLANRVISLALAALIQCFDWERPSEHLIDMSEGAGLTMPKAQPLEAMCKARECMINVLEQL